MKKRNTAEKPHTYDARESVKAMVTATVPREGHYDIDAITDELWMKTDMDTGFMAVSMGEFWGVVDSKRLDTTQLRATEEIIRLLIETTRGELIDLTYSREKGYGNPMFTAHWGDIESAQQYRLDVIDEDEVSPNVQIHQMTLTGDPGDPKEDLALLLYTRDLSVALSLLVKVTG